MTFCVETPEHILRRFIPDGRGLYYLDCKDCFGAGRDNNIFGDSVINTERDLTPQKYGKETSFAEHDMIPTVSKNKAKFTNRDVQQAEAIRRFQHIAGHPSDKTLHTAVTKRSVQNLPFVPKDIRTAKAILGPSIYGLKGKQTYHSQDVVETHDLVPIPRHVADHYMTITIAADVLHINQLPFLATISRNIHYGTCAVLPNMKAETLERAIRSVFQSYALRGFHISHLLVDIQFECLQDMFKDRQIIVNIVSRQEHVPEIERFIRVIKERCRATHSMLPFTRVPKIMIVEMLKTIVFYLNAFPWPGGVSQDLSPISIVDGFIPDYKLHFQVLFGEYAQTYEGTDNTMAERTVGAIALGSSGNIQGGVQFFSLDTGRVLNRSKHDFTLLPMPADVIKRVDRMARRSRSGLVFGDRTNTLENDPIPHDADSDDDDEDYIPPPTDISVDSDSISNTSASDSSDTESTGVTSENENENDSANEDGINIEGNDPDYIDNTGVMHEDSSSDDESDDDDEPHPIHTRSGREVRSTNEPDFVYTTFGETEATQGCRTELTKIKDIDIDLSQHKIKKVNHKEYQNFVRALEYIEQTQEYHDFLMDYTFAQMSIREGLKKHGDDGKKSVMKEINNLASRGCFGEVAYESLTDKQKRHALPILMFMLLKRDGTLKSRGCADGRGQRVWTNKQDVSSPTPAVEALKYVLAIIALEGRDAATFDLPAQFLQTDMDELLHLKITGALALLVVEYDPGRWKKHLRRERGRPVIYVVCKKAIYGTLNAAILAYRKLTDHFQEWGMEMNPYDPCVWNVTVEGTQLTVIFHVDDGLVSHMNPQCVTEFLRKLDRVYGKTDPLTITRGKIHQYLGMTTIEFMSGEVMITMYDYIRKLINKLPPDMIGNKSTAAPEYLFKTNGDSAVKLDKKLADIFHTLTATVLYLGMRARVDLQLATGFLCTRVKSPDEHDWKKLSHMMKYIQATAFLPLILRSDGNGSVIYMDGAHAVHSDMRGHGGLYVTEGKGAMYSSSTKLKLNTLSSTESEIVTVGEKLPKSMWFRLFRISQGGYANEDVLMQDNQSAILLENNGRYSAGKGSKHIDIRYFFITDRIQKKHIKVQFCPTGEMIADFFTKPLQGAVFFKFRDAVLGIKAEDFLQYKIKYYETLKRFNLLTSEDAHKLQECVGEKIESKNNKRARASTRLISNRKPVLDVTNTIQNQDQTQNLINNRQ